MDGPHRRGLLLPVALVAGWVAAGQSQQGPPPAQARVDYFRKLLQQKPNDWTIRAKYANALCSTHQFKEAEAEWDKLHKEDVPIIARIDSHYDRAECLQIYATEDREYEMNEHFQTAKRLYFAEYEKARAAFFGGDLRDCPGGAAEAPGRRLLGRAAAPAPYGTEGRALASIGLPYRFQEGETRVWELSDVILSGQEGIVLDQGGCVVEDSLTIAHAAQWNMVLDFSKLLKPKKHVPSAALAFGLHAGGGFGDYVQRGLTKLMMLLPHLQKDVGRKVLVPGNIPTSSRDGYDGIIPKFVKDLLSLVGIREERVMLYTSVDRGAQLGVGSLLLAGWDELRAANADDPGTPYIYMSHAAPREAFRAFRGIVVAPPAPAPAPEWRLFWVQRKAPELRVLGNEEEIKAALSKVMQQRQSELLQHGQIIAGHPTRVTKMVKAMAKVSSIFGVHGAGLANAVFMPEGAALVELVMPARTLIRLFAHMATACGLSYWPIQVKDGVLGHQQATVTLPDVGGVAAQIADGVVAGALAVGKQQQQQQQQQGSSGARAGGSASRRSKGPGAGAGAGRKLFEIRDDRATSKNDADVRHWELDYSRGHDILWSMPYPSTELHRFYQERPRGFEPRGTAVELGCGRGMDVLWMARQGGFSKVVGVDVSPSAVDDARRHLAAMRANGTLPEDLEVEFHVYDVLKLPAPTQHIDFLWDNTVHQNVFRLGKKGDYLEMLTRVVNSTTVMLVNVMSGDFQPDGEDYSNGRRNAVELNVPLQFNDDLRRDFAAHFHIHSIHQGLYDLKIFDEAFKNTHLGKLDKWPVRNGGIPSWCLLMQLRSGGAGAPEHAILDSRYGFGLYMRAKELVEGGEAARGIEAMEGGYLRFNPLNTHALYDMADVLARGSEFGLAAGYLERVLHAAGPDDDIASQVLDFLVRAGEAERARDFGGKFLKQLRRVRGQKPKPAAGSRPLLFMRHESGEQEFKAALVRGKEVKEALALLSDQAADGEL